MSNAQDWGETWPQEKMTPCQKEFIFGRVYTPETQTVLYHCKYCDYVVNINTKDITNKGGREFDHIALSSFTGQCHYCKENGLYGCSRGR